jgi:hypothetical protein
MPRRSRHAVQFIGIGLPCPTDIQLLLSHIVPSNGKEQQRDKKQFFLHFDCKVRQIYREYQTN